LSIIFEADGCSILIDPGTHSYGGDPAWRRYFRGTSAHNTVELDGCDQAKQQGAFLWDKPFRASVEIFEETAEGGVTAVGCHDGYATRGVRHWRAVDYQPGGPWIVYDLIDGEGDHESALHWHTDATVNEEGEGVLISAPRGPFRVTLSGGELSMHRGALSPRLGWVSPQYGRLKEAVTMRLVATGPLPHIFMTVLSTAECASPQEQLSQRIARVKALIVRECLKR
jgi:hypothetical protein